ncbi:MAG: hypothetical protein VKK04_23295 [Synechococcales bacterium]|nr:hypothetical protein [Synechococcales bacterium]
MLFFLGRLHPRSNQPSVPAAQLKPRGMGRYFSNQPPGNADPSVCCGEPFPDGRLAHEALQQRHRQLEATYFLERSPLR